MSPKISVIITCYNLERYIGAAIGSVLAQDVGHPIEIIVVDDCSTDGSAAIIKAFSEVGYIRTESNSGVLLAMVQGISAATGELIFFLDGDDIWEAEKLAACMAAFEADPSCALVTHDLSFIDGCGNPLARQSKPQEALTPLEPDERSAKVCEGILLIGDYVWLGSALGIRRNLSQLDEFVDWAQALPDPANTYQDWPLAFWIAAIPDNGFAYVPRRLFRYRMHGANHSGDARDSGRALRNLRRTRNTLEAIEQIAISRRLPANVVATVRRRALSFGYLVDLYSGRRAKAFAGFIRAAPDFLRRDEAGKELVRLVAISLLGADRFTKLSGLRSRS